MVYYLFDKTFFQWVHVLVNPDPAGFAIYRPPESGSRSVIQGYGSTTLV